MPLQETKTLVHFILNIAEAHTIILEEYESD